MGRRVLQRTSEKEWYYGELSEDEKVPNGVGLKRERGGAFYYGAWENGLRSGFGALCEPDGGLSVGTWKDDKTESIALRIYPADSVWQIFCGKLEEQKPKDGILFCSDGRLYYGIFSEWNKDDFNGEGALLWPDKRIYAGRWKNGGTDIGGVIRRRDGRMTGTLSNVRNGYTAKAWAEEADQHFFYGITEDEEARNADGILFYADAEFYAGKLRGGQRNGSGIYRSPDDSIYIGEWNNGVLDGQGMCIRWSAGLIHIYIGGFQNSLYEGNGSLMRRSRGEWNFLYSGSWQAGEKSGEGIWNLKEEGVYAGGFHEGKRSGPGEMIAADGSRTAMDWRMGIPHILLEQIKEAGPVRDHYFLGIRANRNGSYQRTMTIEPGCEYEVRIDYHNDTDESMTDGEGTTREARLKTFFTETVKPGEEGVVSASVTFEGDGLSAIWDGIILQSLEELNVRYKIASAKLYNGQKRNGCILSQALFTEGVYLGMDKLDGILPPGSSGYVTFELCTSGEKRDSSVSFSDGENPMENKHIQSQPQELSGKTKKKRHSRISVKVVAAIGTDAYGKTVHADIGEEVHVKIAFTNSVSRRDLTISVILPPAMEYIKESSLLELSDGTKRRLSDDWLDNNLTLSDFWPEGEGEIRFKLRYFPCATASSDSMKIEALIETAEITMHDGLLVMER